MSKFERVLLCLLDQSVFFYKSPRISPQNNIKHHQTAVKTKLNFHRFKFQRKSSIKWHTCKSITSNKSYFMTSCVLHGTLFARIPIWSTANLSAFEVFLLATNMTFHKSLAQSIRGGRLPTFVWNNHFLSPELVQIPRWAQSWVKHMLSIYPKKILISLQPFTVEVASKIFPL